MQTLIAASSSKVRLALRVTLQRLKGVESIREVSDTEELIAQVGLLCPDVVLADSELPGRSMLDWIGAVHRITDRTRVIILASRGETRAAALAAGADGFVCMGDPADALLAAIDRIGLTGPP